MKEVKKGEIEVILDESKVENDTAMILTNSFEPFLKEVSAFEKDVFSIVVTDEGQIEEMQKAREVRLRLKNLRVSADKKRKSLKEDSLRYGKAVQGLYNMIEYKIVPLEKHLEEQENFVKKIIELKKEELRIKRTAALAPYEEFIPSAIELAEITETDFNRIFEGAKVQMKLKKDEEEKAELDRVEKEKAEAAEREKMIKENERLKNEADEREKAAEVESEKQRLVQEERDLKEKEEREAREKIEFEEAEKRKKEKAEADKRLAAETAEKDRLKKELKDKEDEEIRIKKEEAAVKKKSDLAPDKEKILVFSQSLNLIVLPEVKNPEANQVLVEAKEMLNKISIYLLREADKF